MTPSNGIFRVTGSLYVEFTGYRWIHLTKASDAEVWCFRNAGDFWRHRAHYDVIVILIWAMHLAEQ